LSYNTHLLLALPPNFKDIKALYCQYSDFALGFGSALPKLSILYFRIILAFLIHEFSASGLIFGSLLLPTDLSNKSLVIPFCRHLRLMADFPCLPAAEVEFATKQCGPSKPLS